MDSLLVKIFATVLTFSQVAINPDQVTTQFDPTRDSEKVVSLLRAGCAQMRKVFDIETVNLDDLISVAMDDSQAIASGHVAFKGMNIRDLHIAYREFCKNETVVNSPVDIREVIELYNRTLVDLPDHRRLKGLRLPGTSVVLDFKGEPISELQAQHSRRVWVPLSEVPGHVAQTFIAVEDKNFYEHRGIDERALIRAFMGNLAQSGRPQGGSTITQQVVKNLLVGADVTYERKMREMILASRIEATLTKAEILELYLNSIYLGRASWGIEMAARSYFGKSAHALSIGEGALLVAMTKGPNYFNPDRYPTRAHDRTKYVVSRLHEDGAISVEEMKNVIAAPPQLVTYEATRHGSHFVDYIAREAKTITGVDALSTGSSTVHSTLHPELQRATEVSLQEGLARYEMNSGRVEFQTVEANLADEIQRIQADQRTPTEKPAWQQALERAQLALYDVHWPVAIVVEKSTAKRGASLRVGLADGTTLPLVIGKASIRRVLKLHDVVLVRVKEAKGKKAQAELRVRPTVQGAVVVLENKTGRILAMAGGFSYPSSQLNRATQSARQPGSAFKPLTYLAALQKGLQPNTLVRDEPITLPPINGSAREQDYWTPKNYDGGSSGIVTLRQALENSKNLATVNLLAGGIEKIPALSLDRICAIALEAQIYKECVPYYPMVLGAQPVRPIDLAAFYAAIANGGVRSAPYAIESIEHKGSVVYRHAPSLVEMGLADRVSFYQLKAMLQGVLQRGTARSIAHLAPYVAGKTGTTDGENDAWFVGFTNDVTVAIWVGYDNADGARRTLGAGQTGGSVALPIFEPIIQAVWAHHSTKASLSPPSAEARRQMVPTQVDRGTRAARNGKGLLEYLRSDGKGRGVDSEYKLVSKASATGGTVENSKQSVSSREPQVWAHDWGWSGWQQSPRNDEVHRRSRRLQSYPSFW
jgi:penicillin-binding protein 1A